MTKFENGKKYAWAAAICYLLYALHHIVNEILLVSKYSYETEILTIVLGIAFLSMSATLFMKAPKIFIVAVGLTLLPLSHFIVTHAIDAWVDVIYHMYPKFDQFYISQILISFGAYALLAICIFLSLKGFAVVKNAWFIPAVWMLFHIVIFLIDAGALEISIKRIIKREDVLLRIVEVATLFFVGMWLSKNVAVRTKATPVNEYATFNPQRASFVGTTPATISGADKLKTYKELLESGAITQEEFDAKKKEILGL